MRGTLSSPFGDFLQGNTNHDSGEGEAEGTSTDNELSLHFKYAQ